MLQLVLVVMAPLVSFYGAPLKYIFVMDDAYKIHIVDVYAPGVNITTRLNGDRPVTVSGSSYSVAQVSGMAAFIIDMGVVSGKTCDTIKDLALPSIQNPKPGTTRLLLYNGSGL